MLKLNIVLILLFFILIFQDSNNNDQPSSFALVVLPDTQKFTNLNPSVFSAQTRWIAQNQTKYNIKMIIHEGDIVDEDEKTWMWVNASNSLKILDEAQIPYILSIGNHDYSMGKGYPVPNYLIREETNFDKYFPISRFHKDSYGGSFSPRGHNSYMHFLVGDHSFMVISCEIYPRPEVMDWIDDVIAANINKKVIIVTHSFLELDGNRISNIEFWDNDKIIIKGLTPVAMWQRWKKYENLFMILSGHRIDSTGRSARYRVDIGDNGNSIIQILANYQNIFEQNDESFGALRILSFDFQKKTISVQTYSPTNNTFTTDKENQFVINYDFDKKIIY